MKKSFTLIELLVTIAIILLMASISIPIFNSYSAKADLNAKAEEIKYILETAYAEATSPQKGSNGTILDFKLSENSNIKKEIVKFDNKCFVNINDSVCDSAGVEILNKEIISLAGYSINNSKIVSNTNTNTNELEIKILPVFSGVKSYLCYTQFTTTGTSLICNDTDKGFSMEITKGKYSKDIIIYTNPFIVNIN